MRPLVVMVNLSLCLGMLSGAVSADPSKTKTPLSINGTRERETALGDLVADAIMEASGAQAALVNAGQFKPGPSISPGKVSETDIAALLVDPNRKWVISTLTGRSLRLALERSLSRVPQPNPHFLQVSGIKLTYNPQAEVGARIQNLRIDGTSVQDGSQYQVAMPEDLAKGGAGYFTIEGFNENSIRSGSTGTLLSAIGAYLEGHPSIDYSNLDRIVSG
ncbi:MAG: 5'-nucleotidase C-terminal domain-containing protein [Candidatus Zipacnadales bacterium]